MKPSPSPGGTLQRSAYADANVVDFGAIGDGAADDQPAIQAAIDSVMGDGGVVYFPPGFYRCLSQLDLTGWDGNGQPALARSGVLLLGSGTAGPGGGAQLLFDPPDPVNSPYFISGAMANLTIRGLTIGQVSNAFLGDLLFIDNSGVAGVDDVNIQVDECWLAGSPQVSNLQALIRLNQLAGVRIRRTRFEGGAWGVRAKAGADRVVLEDCVFSGQGRSSISRPSVEWLISGCDFEATGSSIGLACESEDVIAWGVTFLACRFGGVLPNAGMRLALNVRGLHVAGCLFSGGAQVSPTAAHIGLFSAEAVAITGNRFDAPARAVWMVPGLLGRFSGISILGNDCELPQFLGPPAFAEHVVASANNNLFDYGVKGIY